MKDDAYIAGLTIVALVLAVAVAVLFHAYSNKGQPERGARTQVVAVCDSRGNTVYTTSTGGIYVLEGCR